MRHFKRSIWILVITLIIVMPFCSCESIKDDRVFFEAILNLKDLEKDMDFFEFKDYFQKKLNRLHVVSKIDDDIFYNNEFGYYTTIFEELDILDYTGLEIYLMDEIQNTETVSTKQYKITYTLIGSDDEEYDFTDYWDIYIENDKIFNGYVIETSDVVKASEDKGHIDDGKIVDEQPVEGETEYGDILRTKVTYMSDGLEVFGYIVRPDVGKTKLPLIVYLRGGYEYKNWSPLAHINGFLSKIASLGYVVIAPQYRGGDIGHDELGGGDLNDAINMIELAKNLEYVDADTIYLLGISRGGLMTLLVAKKNIEGIKGGAIFSGLYSVLFNYIYYNAHLHFGEEVGLGTPDENIIGYVKRSADFWAYKIDIPLLMVHGTEDYEHCPIIQVYEFMKQMDRYGKEYEFIEIEGCGHNTWVTDQIDPYNKVDEFFKSITD